jgi:hypothetical protein
MTEQAVLTDAVTQGTLDATAPLGFDQLVTATPAVAGVTVTAQRDAEVRPQPTPPSRGPHRPTVS